MPLAANDPTDRVEQLIILTDRLTGLLARETELLKDHRPHEITEFQDERTTLSTLYAQEMQLIAKNNALIDGVEQGLSTQLKISTETFQEQLVLHARALNRVRLVGEGMVKAIAEDRAQKDKIHAGYGSTGALNAAKNGAPTTIAVHEVI